MARIRFTHDFDYKPLPSVTIAYLAGMVCVVKRQCAEQAIAANKAVDFHANGNDGHGEAENDR